MAAIAKLPEDVLYLIILYFERDEKFLCVLCRVNRPFIAQLAASSFGTSATLPPVLNSL
jgi:hypothetical protein